MRYPAAALFFMALSIGSHAQTRPSTTAMTCQAAQALVQAQGAIVIGTGGDTYERVVRNHSFCATGTQTRPFFAPAKDNPSCLIGDACYEVDTERQ